MAMPGSLLDVTALTLFGAPTPPPRSDKEHAGGKRKPKPRRVLLLIVAVRATRSPHSAALPLRCGQ
jgi:hypothetical protein